MGPWVVSRVAVLSAPRFCAPTPRVTDVERGREEARERGRERARKTERERHREREIERARGRKREMCPCSPHAVLGCASRLCIRHGTPNDRCHARAAFAHTAG